MSSKLFTKLDLLVLLIVFLIGLLHLSYPFDGDQALFTVGAQKMAHGAVLYRDFWDLKQPGIFVFYLFGGTLFGFSEAGIHFFELLYMIALAVVLVVTLKSRFESRRIASLLPLLTVGIYYGVAGAWHLTQAEGLVSLPLYLALWFADGGVRDDGNVSDDESGAKKRRWWWWRAFLSGLMGGFVLLFKFLFAPMLLGFWAVALFDATVRKREPLIKVFARLIVPITLGALVPLVASLIYFAAFDTLAFVNYAYFEYPARAVRELPRVEIDRLINALRWFLAWSAPLIALGFLGACASIYRRKESLYLNLLLWFIIGLGVILIQRLSWWEYHFMLLFVPLGVLATKGLDVVWQALKENVTSFSSSRVRILAALTVALLFVPVMMSLSLKSLAFARAGFTLRKERRLAYQAKISQTYDTALKETAFLAEPNSLPGGIFIGGNPAYYYLSQREQAIASNGWMLELFLPEQWRALNEEISRARPAYILIAPEYIELIPQRSPETQALLDANYRVLRRTNAGVWYELRSAETRAVLH